MSVYIYICACAYICTHLTKPKREQKQNASGNMREEQSCKPVINPLAGHGFC